MVAARRGRGARSLLGSDLSPNAVDQLLKPCEFGEGERAQPITCERSAHHRVFVAGQRFAAAASVEGRGHMRAHRHMRRHGVAPDRVAPAPVISMAVQARLDNCARKPLNDPSPKPRKTTAYVLPACSVEQTCASSHFSPPQSKYEEDRLSFFPCLEPFVPLSIPNPLPRCCLTGGCQWAERRAACAPLRVRVYVRLGIHAYFNTMM